MNLNLKGESSFRLNTNQVKYEYHFIGDLFKNNVF